jgi:tetratricopeptide (TPR) repeat protein
MDLGVAKLQEASIRITKEGQFAGSILYAAPEQFNDKEVGPESDLYSLGVMLYELATGTNPYRRDDAAAVITAHLKLMPGRANELNPDLSSFFSEVLATLLAKDPADRIESAAFLQELLEQGESSKWWAEREQALRKQQKTLPKIRVRRETELHGREKQLAQLQAAWEGAQQGQGNTVLIDGEPGIGKTRLVDAFLHTLGEDDVHLLYGSYPPSGGMGGISDAVLGKFGSAGLEDSLRPYMKETPSLVPAFAALAKHESPPTGSEQLAGDALHAVSCNLARALAVEKPTIWIVDELHFAPAESRNLVLSLARAVDEHRILLIVTSRPGLPEDELAHLHSLENFKRITLDRLSPRGVIELVRDALKSEVLANSLGAQVAYKSDGVPLFVFEIIRGLKESGFLKQQEDGSYAQSRAIEDITVPSAIKDLVEARLKELSQEERAILDVGAVLGFEFDPDLVARVRDTKRVQVLETLAAIERRTGVVRAKGRSYSFDHQQVQEVLHATLSEVLREEYHTMLAEAFAKREGYDEDDPPEGEDAVFLAWHALHGSEPRFGLPYLLTALDYLGSAYRPDTALSLAERALGAKRLLKGTARIDVLLRVAQHLDRLARRDEESSVLREALDLADKSDDIERRSRVRRAIAWQSLVLGRHEESQRLLDEAVKLVREGASRREQAAVAGALGMHYLMTGKHEDSRQRFEEYLSIAEEIGDKRGQVLATGRLATMYQKAGKFREAVRYMQQSIVLAREVRNREREAVNLINLAEAQARVGQVEDAQGQFEEACSILRPIGSLRYTGYAEQYQGACLEQLGRNSEAASLYESSAALFREVDDIPGQSWSCLLHGRLLRNGGDLVAATHHLEEGLALAGQVDAPEIEAYAAAQFAALPGGDVDAARASLSEHGSRLEAFQEMEAYFTLWQAAKNALDLERARTILDRLQEHTPAEYHQSMIDNVPIISAITQAWEAHGQ